MKVRIGSDRTKGARLEDARIEALLAQARPAPAPLSEESVERAYRAMLAAAPAPPRRRFGPARFAFATMALGCAVALAWYGKGTPDEPSVVPVVTPATSVELPVAPRAGVSRPAAPASGPVQLAGFHPAPARRSRPRVARWTGRRARPATHVAKSARPDESRPVDAALAQILVVTATDPLPRVTVEPAEADAEEYARVAVYTPGPAGGTASECTISLTPAGEESVRYAAQEDAGPTEVPYLSVEVKSAAADAPALESQVDTGTATESDGKGTGS